VKHAWVVASVAAVLAAANGCTDDTQFFNAATAGPTTGGAGGTGGRMHAGGGGRGGSTSTGSSMCGENQPATIGCDPACDSCENGVCILSCNAFNDCSNQMLKCPSGLACEVRCTDDACRATTITCPKLHACSVVCEGGQSCRDAHLVCAIAPTDGTCDMSCAGSTDVCRDATVDCGANQCTATCGRTVTPPTVACGPSCSCTECN
jgi:hypothetical protein